jgi:hypothetical protein
LLTLWFGLERKGERRTEREAEQCGGGREGEGEGGGWRRGNGRKALGNARVGEGGEKAEKSEDFENRNNV